MWVVRMKAFSCAGGHITHSRAVFRADRTQPMDLCRSLSKSQEAARSPFLESNKGSLGHVPSPGVVQVAQRPSPCPMFLFVTQGISELGIKAGCDIFSFIKTFWSNRLCPARTQPEVTELMVHLLHVPHIPYLPGGPRAEKVTTTMLQVQKNTCSSAGKTKRHHEHLQYPWPVKSRDSLSQPNQEPQDTGEGRRPG